MERLFPRYEEVEKVHIKIVTMVEKKCWSEWSSGGDGKWEGGYDGLEGKKVGKERLSLKQGVKNRGDNVPVPVDERP